MVVCFDLRLFVLVRCGWKFCWIFWLFFVCEGFETLKLGVRVWGWCLGVGVSTLIRNKRATPPAGWVFLCSGAIRSPSVCGSRGRVRWGYPSAEYGLPFYAWGIHKRHTCPPSPPRGMVVLGLNPAPAVELPAICRAVTCAAPPQTQVRLMRGGGLYSWWMKLGKGAWMEAGYRGEGLVQFWKVSCVY